MRRGGRRATDKPAIVIRREEIVGGAHHGGSWKVAYADFVTAMMAFFLLMWLLNATTEEQRKGLADYFSPNAVLSHSSSGTGQPFGGQTAFSSGAMVSDKGGAQVTVGQQPVVDQVDEDDSEVIAQPRPHRDDAPSLEPDRQGVGRAPPRPGSSPTRSGAAGKPAGAVATITLQPSAAAIAPTADGIRQDRSRAPTEAELRAEAVRREKQEFEEAAQQIREAVRTDPALAELARQLVIDMTPDGLRIQVLDDEHVSMFPLGSATPNDRARLLLQKVAPILAHLTQDISIAGHTDSAPFPGPGRTNWELSAERANATRRLLVDAGLQQVRIRSVTGNADRDPLVQSDPLAAANRRISVVVLRSTRSFGADASPPMPVAPVPPTRAETNAPAVVPAELPETR
jgi:chemotaxis protein MotB